MLATGTATALLTSKCLHRSILPFPILSTHYEGMTGLLDRWLVGFDTRSRPPCPQSFQGLVHEVFLQTGQVFKMSRSRDRFDSALLMVLIQGRNIGRNPKGSFTHPLPLSIPIYFDAGSSPSTCFTAAVSLIILKLSQRDGLPADHYRSEFYLTRSGLRA